MKSKCIILGDAYQNTLEGIRGLLESTFDKIVMVSNLPSLLEVIKKIKPEYAVVDMSVLGSDRVKFVSETKKLFPNLKLVVISFGREPEIVDSIMSAGASGFILKQFADTDLLEAFDNIEQGRTFVSPAVQDGYEDNQE